MHEPTNILITGASDGIGAALAEEYAATDVTLMICARREDKLNAVGEKCRAKGATVVSQVMDVSNTPAMTAWVKKMDTAHPLDLVIANAGISAGGDSTDTIAEHIEQVFAVNVQGVFNTVHPALPGMKKRGNGQIGIVSSVMGYAVFPRATSYNTTKMTVKGYGEGLRGLVAKDNIKVSVICPGYVRTPMTTSNEKIPVVFPIDADKAAVVIREGLAKNKGRIAFRKQHAFIMRTMQHLPYWLLDKMFTKYPQVEPKEA
ncbi:MAG: SDR family NAD(P)-dependent oxidoreductase [Rhodospirillaceae bacterium]|jgi:short-subunit dehydrogenase|nr:SDR family NAD(P)-dependent oxidoreductase [Rhodospirillaceae bacterium]